MRRSIRGVIDAIAESWPLQLMVTSGRDNVAVALDEHTAVVHEGRVVPPTALEPGQEVAVGGVLQPGHEPAIHADRVEILSRGGRRG